jgi:hypothetical protein
MQCATHPRVETYLTCGTCGKAICYRCMVETPVGFRCADDARLRANPVFTLSADQTWKAVGAGLGLAVAGGIAWGLVKGFPIGFLFLTILAGMGIGNLIGQNVGKAGNRKRSQALVIIAGGSALLAYFVGNVLSLFWWSDVPLSQSLAHFWADEYRGIFALGIGGFKVTIWNVLSGLLSVGMAASRIR